MNINPNVQSLFFSCYIFHSSVSTLYEVMPILLIFHHYMDDDEFYSIPVEIIGEVLSEVDEKGKTPA